MIASYPQVPTGYELGVGCAAQSYDGKLFFGLTADAQAAPDVTRLRDFIQVSFRELRRAAAPNRDRKGVGLKHPEPSAKRRRARATQAARV